VAVVLAWEVVVFQSLVVAPAALEQEPVWELALAQGQVPVPEPVLEQGRESGVPDRLHRTAR